MNDFNKEELEIMRWYIQKETKTPPMSHIDLLCKIQMLIDDFCDHEFCLQGKGRLVFAECIKCHDVWRLIR